MSGHSKWATIKRKKEKTDAQRGKSFTKIGRELAVAVKMGGPDPLTNSKLSDAIAKAKANNMPNDTIFRSIKKAAGEMDGAQYEEVVYEGYGPGGAAVILEILTDNRNRIAAEVRHIFDKFGGALGNANCVGWMFERKGVILVENGPDEDDLMLAALDAGADDFQPQEGGYQILTSPEAFSAVRAALEQAGYAFAEAEIDRIPQNTVELTGGDLSRFEKMLELFEDNEDIQNVFHNADLPETEEDE